MSGGFPAAMRVRTSGMKSRAEVYSTLMPVAFVNAAVTLRNASFSLPPQSERTSMEPALLFVGFALIAVAVNPAARTAGVTADAMSDLRRFPRILLLLQTPLSLSMLSPTGPAPSREIQLCLGIEDMELVR